MAQERDALALLHASVQRAFSTVTKVPLKYSRPLAGAPYRLTFAAPRAACGNGIFVVWWHYFVLSGGLPRPTGYLYAVEDQNGVEILSYHWHPASPPDTPHLHLGHGSGVRRAELLSGAHLPTGAVDWPQFLEVVRLFAPGSG